MPAVSQTERNLKDALNSNQKDRERMCLDVLATMPGYAEVRPRLPKGGPDGGRDIQALYDGELCFGAVGFKNDATATEQHRREISAKFNEDLKAAREATDDLGRRASHFVFFTNVGLTPSILTELKTEAISNGFKTCDVLDSERLRIELDSSKGYAIRFRYLGIAMNDAEQKVFFTEWGSELNKMVATKLGGLDDATKRIQFLLEAQLLVDTVTTVIRLKKDLNDISGGQFLFQTDLSLRSNVKGLMGFHYGSGTNRRKPIDHTDEKGRFISGTEQYGYSFAWVIEDLTDTGAKEWMGENPERPQKTENEDQFIRVYWSSGGFGFGGNALNFNSGNKPFILRSGPSFPLIELDGCWLLFRVTESLAKQIETLSVYANGYELLKLTELEWVLESDSSDSLYLPKEAVEPPVGDGLVTLRPRSGNSTFHIDLMHETPRRYNWTPPTSVTNSHS